MWELEAKPRSIGYRLIVNCKKLRGLRDDKTTGNVTIAAGSARSAALFWGITLVSRGGTTDATDRPGLVARENEE
jgi:hypothetical protein